MATRYFTDAGHLDEGDKCVAVWRVTDDGSVMWRINLQSDKWAPTTARLAGFEREIAKGRLSEVAESDAMELLAAPAKPVAAEGQGAL